MQGSGSWLPVPVPAGAALMEEPTSPPMHMRDPETQGGWDAPSIAKRSQQLNDLRDWADGIHKSKEVESGSQTTPRVLSSSDEVWHAVFSEIASLQQDPRVASLQQDPRIVAEVLDAIQKVREEMGAELSSVRATISKLNTTQDLLSLRASTCKLGERLSSVESRLSHTEEETLEIRDRLELRGTQEQGARITTSSCGQTIQTVASNCKALRGELDALHNVHATWQCGQDQLSQAIGFLSHDIEELRESMARGFSKLWLELEHRKKVPIPAARGVPSTPPFSLASGSLSLSCASACAHSAVLPPPVVASQGGPGSISNSQTPGDVRHVNDVNHCASGTCSRADPGFVGRPDLAHDYQDILSDTMLSDTTLPGSGKKHDAAGPGSTANTSCSNRKMKSVPVSPIIPATQDHVHVEASMSGRKDNVSAESSGVETLVQGSQQERTPAAAWVAVPYTGPEPWRPFRK